MTIDNKKISILIPMYNHEKYVEECLASVKNTEYDNYEIIIIDDGSKDNTYEVALNYIINNKLQNQTKINRQNNCGINKTINRMIEMSSGDLFLILASDDAILKNTLNTINKHFTKIRDPHLCIFNVNIINEKSEIIKPKWYANLEKKYYINFILFIKLLFKWRLPYAHQSFNREFIEVFGKLPENLKYEDRYLALFAVINKCIGLDKGYIKNYRIRREGDDTPGLSTKDLAILPVINELIIKNRNNKRNKFYVLYLFILKIYSKKCK